MFAVVLVLDSARRAALYGHVALWFTGHMNVEPDQFGLVTGTVDQDGEIALHIPRVAVPEEYRVWMVILSDELVVLESRNGVVPGPFRPGSRFTRVTAATQAN